MDPLDRTLPSLEALQRRVTANLQRLQRDGSIVSTPTTSPPATAAKSQENRKLLRRRLQALDGDDPRFSTRAADAFVESVLLEEFGDSLTNDANFRQLILQVSQDMRSDAATARNLDVLFNDLRGK